MRQLSTTEKVLMATGAAVLVGAAAVGIAVLIKKRKALAGEIKELVIDHDEEEFTDEDLAEA